LVCAIIEYIILYFYLKA